MPQKPINCFYVNLSDYPVGTMPKTMDGMSAGTFTDMYGREFTFLAEELPVYVAKTKLALESTKDSTGNVVGFPIDTYDHVNGLAAGWIVDVNMSDDGRNIVQITPRWTGLGTNAIEADTMRYFSPSIDNVQQVIVGGSLTNWPATRTQDHQILLHPVELSASLLTPDAPEKQYFNLLSSLRSLYNELRGKPVQPEPEPQGEIMPEPTAPVSAVVNLSDPVVMAAIESRVAELTTARLAEAERLNGVKAFVASLSEKTPTIDAEGLTAFLSSLTPEAAAKGMEIIKSTVTAEHIDFTEHGHGRQVNRSQPLPDSLKPIMLSWLKDGRTKAEFFQINAVELGNMEDYNLTEFVEKENK